LTTLVFQGREEAVLGAACAPAATKHAQHVICGRREYGSARTCSADDQGKEKPTLLFFRQASIGTDSLNTILPSSRLLLPVLPRPLAA
jgi:hypothetical protein